MTGPAARRLSESNRVEAFSDGVFAIALTLLVLDLHAPEEKGSFGHVLATEWPTYVAYLAAFLNIASIWVNHHDIFTRVRRVDMRLVCLNLILLFVSSLLPWPASVISSAYRFGDRHDQLVAMLLYAAAGFLVPVAFTVLYRSLAKAPHLLEDPVDSAYLTDGARKTRFALVAYPLAAALAFVAPLAALIAFVLVPAFFMVTLFVEKPARRSSA